MESLPIHPYDILMLVLLTSATIFGAWKGMAWQVASLASLVLSCFVALRFSAMLAPHISDKEPWNYFLAMLILYLVTSLGVWLVFRLVAGAIDRVRLREFDRQLGAIIGLAKGVLLCLVVTFFGVTLSDNVRQSVLNAKSGHYIAMLIQKTSPVMPDRVRGYLDELDRKLTPGEPSVESVETVESTLEDRIQNEIDDRINKSIDDRLPSEFDFIDSEHLPSEFDFFDSERNPESTAFRPVPD